MIFGYCKERFCFSHWRAGSCISMLFFPVIFATFVMHITKPWTEISCHQSTLTLNFQTIQNLLFSIRIQIFFFFFVTSTHIVFFCFCKHRERKKKTKLNFIYTTVGNSYTHTEKRIRDSLVFFCFFTNSITYFSTRQQEEKKRNTNRYKNSICLEIRTF